jgi:hypothetical protein
MSSAEDSPAKTSASAVKEKAWPESDLAYGESTPVLLANYDHDTPSWKTFQHSCFGGLETFSETWPRSGTMQNGIAYQLLPLAPLTVETESGSWPTPAAHEARLGYQNRNNGKKGDQKSLTTVVIDSMGGRDKVSGQLNPTWVEWLMGFPLGHTDLKPSEMPSSRKSPKSSAEQ